MSPVTTRKSFKASLESLTPIRDFLLEQGEQAGLTQRQIGKLCLAVDEIATNIINYGYLGSGIENAEIEVIISVENNRLKVVTEDQAIEFNPLEKDLPDEEELSKPLEERKIGGLGIMLALQSVDEFDYRYENKKNINIFYVNLVNQKE